MNQSTWTVFVDQKPIDVAPQTTLAQIITQLDLAPEQIATALNGQFIARQNREQHVLQANDNIMVFQAIVGG